MAELSKSELDFFGTLVNGQVKEAVDLSNKTRAILGAENHPEHELDRLEREAHTGQSIPPDDLDGQAATTLATSVTPPLQAEGLLAPPAPQPVDDEPPVDDEELPAPDASPSNSAPPNRTTHGKLFSSKNAHPLVIKSVLDFKYEQKWDEWEPETLWWAIRRDFGPVGEIARNKIMALRVAMRTDVPWLDWDIFENCGVAWTDGLPIFGAFQPLAPSQLAFAVQTLRSIRAEETFENEVVAYMAATLETNGLVLAPTEWFPPEVQALLDRKVWILPLKADVQKAWESARELADPKTIDWNESSPVDLNVMRLLVVRDYLARRAREVASAPMKGTGSAVSGPTSPPVPS